MNFVGFSFSDRSADNKRIQRGICVLAYLTDPADAPRRDGWRLSRVSKEEKEAVVRLQ